MHGSHINCTDGRYVLMRAPVDKNLPLYNYTLMPCHINKMFSLQELENIELGSPFDFTKNCRVLKIPARCQSPGGEPLSMEFQDLLFDLENDPGQERPLDYPALKRRMLGFIREHLQEHDAPEELYTRYGI